MRPVVRFAVVLLLLLLLLAGGVVAYSTLTQRPDPASTAPALPAVVSLAGERGGDDESRDAGESLENVSRRRARAGRPDEREPGLDQLEQLPRARRTDEEGVRAARELAAEAIDAFRDGAHREQVRIVWPEGAVPPVPDEARVYLIKGYRSFRCTRFALRRGGVEASRLWIRRDPRRPPEAMSVRTTPLSASVNEFSSAFRAALLVAQTRAELKAEPPESNVIGGSFSMSSHADYRWVRVRIGGNTQPFYEGVVRGTSRTGGLRSYAQIRNEAIYRLFDQLVVEEPGGESDRSWFEFLVDDLMIAAESLESPLSTTDRIRLDTTGWALGLLGDPAAVDVIDLVLPKIDRDGVGERTATILEAAAEKLLLQDDEWSPERAAAVLRDRTRTGKEWDDFRLWLREMMRELDGEEYRNVLLTDAGTATDRKVVEESLDELRRHYPESLGAAMPALLDHADAEVRVDAALTLAKEDPLPPRVLDVLDAAARDVTIVPPKYKLAHTTARVRAIEFLVSEQAPESRRWTSERMREQLETEGENGDVANILMGLLYAQGEALPVDEQTRIFHRILDGPRKPGILQAARQLLKLGDEDAVPKIRKLLDELYRSRADLEWVSVRELQNLSSLVRSTGR